MSRIVRVHPSNLKAGWREDLEALGVTVPEQIPTSAYTPVAHDPMPFSVDVDLDRMRVVKRTVGVMPNAVYKGHIYSWEEFCSLVGKEACDTP